MLQLDFTKVKVPWVIIALVLLYLAAAVIFAAVFWPARGEVQRLAAEVELLERSNENLTRVVNQRPALTERQVQLTERLEELMRTVPSQYDLPKVLEAIEELSAQYGLSLEKLSHVPLGGNQLHFYSEIPITLEVSGGPLVLSFYEQLFTTLPALRLDHFRFSYSGKAEFGAQAELLLRVLILEQEQLSGWQIPALNREIELVLPRTSFGLPFSTLQEYLPGRIRVLGIVNSGAITKALISRGAEKDWVKTGDRLGEAKVDSVSGQGVWLDVDGVQIELKIGG